MEVAVPRDRKGEFEPQLLKKNQTSVFALFQKLQSDKDYPSTWNILPVRKDRSEAGQLVESRPVGIP